MRVAAMAIAAVRRCFKHCATAERSRPFSAEDAAGDGSQTHSCVLLVRVLYCTVLLVGMDWSSSDSPSICWCLLTLSDKHLGAFFVAS